MNNFVDFVYKIKNKKSQNYEKYQKKNIKKKILMQKYENKLNRIEKKKLEWVETRKHICMFF